MCKVTKPYVVVITETLQLTVQCETHSLDEAESIVHKKYIDGAYILGAEQFTDVTFTVSEKKEPCIDGIV